jgi:hypothetical protein
VANVRASVRWGTCTGELRDVRGRAMWSVRGARLTRRSKPSLVHAATGVTPLGQFNVGRTEMIHDAPEIDSVFMSR